MSARTNGSGMPISLKTHAPTPAHTAFMNDLKAALGKHTDLGPQDMLAVASQFVGNLTAMQDQRRYTPADVMEIVARNIEVGNLAAVSVLMDSAGSA